jgi:EF hand domain-containing protein
MRQLMAIVAVLGITAGALAQEGGGAKAGAKAAPATFDQIDTNHDGVISKSELLAFFAKMDANQDGSLSRDEYAVGFTSPAAAPAGEGGKKGAEGGKKVGDAKRGEGDGARKAGGDGDGGAKKGGEGDGSKKGGEGNKKGD